MPSDDGHDSRGVPRINRDGFPSDSDFEERSRDPLAPNDPLTDAERLRERVHPAPLAGVEPLEGHAVDPDAEETSIEDALIKDRADVGEDVSAELDTTPARFGGREGLGVMRVVRSADGNTVSMPGTWRPTGTAGFGAEFDAGSQVRYEGPLHRGDGTVEDVAVEVTVTSTGRYTTEDGQEYMIVNFEGFDAANRIGPAGRTA